MQVQQTESDDLRGNYKEEGASLNGRVLAKCQTKDGQLAAEDCLGWGSKSREAETQCDVM